ncbi:VanZ family protein [Streptococcus suis]|uniref:VanZ family protein n=1 Tax=Streptococcus suivaginalis TaxID=3028082 RepID=A0AA96VDE9_9STRE|nr:VanZ family protein [Streptococcus sp. 29896]MCK4028166.1 VanZ family protein [Streptococcus suis]WNY46644.1 VanZ family protein [Streptococcus sp. 29896]
MRHLFDESGQVAPLGRKILWWLCCLYTGFIVYLCFLPQGFYPGMPRFQLPGIIQIGRVYLLLIPFNTIVNGSQAGSLQDFILAVLQNFTNIFLLFPLVFAFLFLFEKWRSLRAIIRYSFLMSLFIETSQLVLDLLFDVGRVVEIDDLWTNTLGGVLAYFTYQLWIKAYQHWTKYQKP